jgi:hypothetical protein
MSSRKRKAWFDELVTKTIGHDRVRAMLWLELAREAQAGKGLVTFRTRQWELCADAENASLIEVRGDVRTMPTNLLLVGLEQWAGRVEREVKRWRASLERRSDSAVFDAWRRGTLVDTGVPLGPRPRLAYSYDLLKGGRVFYAVGPKDAYATPASFLFAALDALHVNLDASSARLLTHDEAMHELRLDHLVIEQYPAVKLRGPFVCAVRFHGATRARNVLVETRDRYVFSRWEPATGPTG